MEEDLTLTTPQEVRCCKACSSSSISSSNSKVPKEEDPEEDPRVFEGLVEKVREEVSTLLLWVLGRVWDLLSVQWGLKGQCQVWVWAQVLVRVWANFRCLPLEAPCGVVGEVEGKWV